MRYALMFEVVVLFLAPLIMAILRRRGSLRPKPAAAAVASLLSLLMATYSIHLYSPLAPLSLSLAHWVVVFGLAVFAWAVSYPVALLAYKQWLRG